MMKRWKEGHYPQAEGLDREISDRAYMSKTVHQLLKIQRNICSPIAHGWITEPEGGRLPDAPSKVFASRPCSGRRGSVLKHAERQQHRVANTEEDFNTVFSFLLDLLLVGGRLFQCQVQKQTNMEHVKISKHIFLDISAHGMTFHHHPPKTC